MADKITIDNPVTAPLRKFVHSTALCPICGAPWRRKRFGVPMSPLKTHLIDMLRAAGKDGILLDAILERMSLGGDPSRRARLRTLNVHVNQINDKLEDTGWRIFGRDGRKFIARRPKKALPIE